MDDAGFSASAVKACRPSNHSSLTKVDARVLRATGVPELAPTWKGERRFKRGLIWGSTVWGRGA